jgi:hypothetical protein
MAPWTELNDKLRAYVNPATFPVEVFLPLSKAGYSLTTRIWRGTKR